MRCPYCRTRLEEISPECPSCKLTFDRATALLGPMPRLSAGVSDLTRALPKSDVKKINKAIDGLTWTFPQVTLNVLLHVFPTEHPFDLHVFWIFNAGGLSPESHKGGDSRSILLVLDPQQKKSSLMVGYGLEPYLGDEAMAHLLELSEPAWKAGEWTRGILELIAGLDRLLESAALEVANGFGLNAMAVPPRLGDY
ncbi:TPM domain-containing protein [Luteolibacter flavescens]|uniref:TPM domain-containing protein n=1 Tax=Luteolibacter flavescens TaxID=1859460 RepID=A0ABT3FSI5_9BACT|nr:TPM domain-containing protein [Luteolibacter flavescens]MCW1886402.1 TPM domain-containing protein [Luteolibacter flavescens]